MRKIYPVIEDLDALMEFPRQGVFSKVLAKTPGSNYTLMCLAQGSDISEHTSTREAAVIVLKGTGVFMLGRKKIVMKPGVFIFMPKNAPHSLSADENLAIVLSIFG
ncbi:MAG TPA: cupin domain-containing protein [Candidatus Omnitrophota bacterium]|nr:cupin domain-containing protein [Candidatus Omnitrophota bacterium]HPT07043.1 cupin domain-containing protein [Candidatus Omnitrophota bacterium]